MNEKAVNCPVFGIFSLVKNLSGKYRGNNSDNEDTRICFMPSRFLYNELEGYEPNLPTNLPSMSHDELLRNRPFADGRLVKVNYG